MLYNYWAAGTEMIKKKMRSHILELFRAASVPHSSIGLKHTDFFGGRHHENISSLSKMIGKAG
ncbi:MAG: hypothetical protein DKM50_09435 [Candidatus Margulisiibacteriota bacterium]|nr:MAG: hypothetical protein DKM50_09435 [Candidatus Margulisiibacteriota bacterium]